MCKIVTVQHSAAVESVGRERGQEDGGQEVGKFAAEGLLRPESEEQELGQRDSRSETEQERNLISRLFISSTPFHIHFCYQEWKVNGIAV